MMVIPADDPRAVSTADAYIGRYEGRLLGHGNSERGFPWSAGVLASILAWQHRGDLAWAALEGARPTICTFGGMTEVMENDEWNMQYFGTAQGACCVAIHQMLLQSHVGEMADIELFPAIPSSWDRASFERLLAEGFAVSAKYTPTQVDWTVTNVSPERLTRTIHYRDQSTTVELGPDDEMHLVWSI
jgi:hypothetical protein